MANYRIKLNLTKLNGAFIHDVKGRTSTKRCVCIPIAESGIFEGKLGAYLTINAHELREPRYEDTHCLKPVVSSERFNSMSEDEKRNIPIIGGMHESQRDESRAGESLPPAAPASAPAQSSALAEMLAPEQGQTPAQATAGSGVVNDDLPF